MVNQPHHFIGIGGIGMSALARILLDRKIPTSGSDLVLTPNTEKLIHEGARVHIGHSPDAVPKGAKVVYSTSVSKSNPEMSSALQQKMPVLHRSDLLAELMRGYKTLCVTGTHGKTTTSALLAHVLQEANLDPSYAIGGILKNQMTNGKAGQGEFFVAEADESDGSFLKYPCFGAILTNIGHEHLDYFGSFNALVGAFASFIAHVSSPDHLFYCADDAHLCSLIDTVGTSYGFSEHAALRITRFAQKGWSIDFDVTFEEKLYSNITIPLVGEHNALNAVAVFGLALRLGIADSEIIKAFASFKGIVRRQDVKGEVNSITVIDDYAHHPKEIQATLAAFVRAMRERRHVVIFQPHRFSRTKAHFEALAHAFDGADLLFITDLYPAGEEPIDGISAQDLIRHIRAHTDLPVFHLPKKKGFDTLLPHVRPYDVITTFGAGDITLFATNLVTKLAESGLNKWQIGIIEGGRSAEHEISLRSSACVKEALNPTYYTQKVFRIDKGGNWHIGDHSGPISDPVILRAIESCDLFFPVLHGPYGEDGVLQGFFELLDKPYVGPDFRSCALCMDKALSKILVEAAGVPTPPFVQFDHIDYEESKDVLLAEIEKEISYPLYIKPLRLGSSIGVSKVHDRKEFYEAAQEAFRYDTKLMAEKACEDCRELEFAVLGNTSATIEVPPPGEAFSLETSYDYKGKYGANPIRKETVATLDQKTLKLGQQMAKQAYIACQCEGLARVDFFLDKAGTFWFLEIQPIPGLTKTSLYPRIWANRLGDFSALLDRFVILAWHKSRSKNKHMCFDVR